MTKLRNVRARTIIDVPTARERLISTSYELFTRRGICDVGVDEVVRKAGVAEPTLYRHFPSKEDLVLAFLDRRAELWTGEVIDRQPRQRAEDPKGQLLALFDVLDEWFHRRSDYEACSFVNVLFEVAAECDVDAARRAKPLNLADRGAHRRQTQHAERCISRA